MREFTGKQYLQMDIAGRYGLDKATWDERLDWFKQHEGDLHAMQKTAAEPAMFFAAVTAWEDCVAKRPSGYAVSLDATCSAMQLLSVLTGDRLAAELCNVIDIGKCSDAYTTIYERMADSLAVATTVSRDQAKSAILYSLYGSTAEPKKVFGDGPMLDVFYNTMRASAPAAWELNETYVSIWNPEAYKYTVVLPDNFHMHMKVMGEDMETVQFAGSSYEVFTKVNKPVEGGRMLGANCNHGLDGMIVREMTARCNYDPVLITAVKLALHMAKPAEVGEEHLALEEESIMCNALWTHYMTTGYLSARILECINEYTASFIDHDVIRELMASLPPKPFRIQTVHDCFRCLPNYANEMRKQYNLQLHLIGKSTILSSILSQLLGHRVEIGKLDPTMYKEVLNAEYALS